MDTNPAAKLFTALERPAYPGPAECCSDAFVAEAASVKQACVSAGDQASAAQVWKAEQIAQIQRQFIEAFDHLKAGEYFEGWCLFERVEIALDGLLNHYQPMPGDPHRIKLIQAMTMRWQELYPYKHFLSPEILKREMRCSVCDAIVKPRSRCVHRKGQIYNGEACYHIVTQCEFLSISLVTNPVQKYSVVRHIEDEHGKREIHNYAHIKFAADRLKSPFDRWRTLKTTRDITAEQASHISEADRCPCMSGNTFSECCLGKSVITVPHLQFVFAAIAPEAASLPNFELVL